MKALDNTKRLEAGVEPTTGFELGDIALNKVNETENLIENIEMEVTVSLEPFRSLVRLVENILTYADMKSLPISVAAALQEYAQES